MVVMQSTGVYWMAVYDTLDFEGVYRNYGEGAELKREKYTAHFVFVVKDRVPNAMIPVNPLGLTITYFREDQAFQ